MTAPANEVDVAVVGAGGAGLSLVRAVAAATVDRGGSPPSVALVDPAHRSGPDRTWGCGDEGSSELAPLLHRLRVAGVRFAMRHRWTGWAEEGALRFSTPEGERLVTPRATLLALGGACSINDPTLNAQPAIARPPPDIPFKPGLQEDNGSVKPPPGG